MFNVDDKDIFFKGATPLIKVHPLKNVMPTSANYLNQPDSN